MQVIYCNINIFDYDQSIYLVDGNDSRLIARIPFTNLGRSLIDVCESKGVYNVHLFCNVKGMAEQAADAVTEQEIKQYGKAKIEIQVN